MKNFSSRILNFFMQNLSTATDIAAAKKLSKKWGNFVN